MQRPTGTPMAPAAAEQKAWQSCLSPEAWALVKPARAVEEGRGFMSRNAECSKTGVQPGAKKPTEHRDDESDKERKLGHCLDCLLRLVLV